MIYYVVGLAVIGVAVGLVFRWKILLPFIVLLPFAAIIFSVSRGFNYRDTALAVIVAEAVLQGGYFAGLLIRFVSTASMRSAGILGLFKGRRGTAAGSSDGHAAPSAEAGKGP